MVKEILKRRLKVKISDNRADLGALAAKESAEYILKLLSKKREVNIIFASAPSQNEFLANLLTYDIDWSKVNAFHLDEYVNLSVSAPQSFGNFLKVRIFDKRKFKSVHYLNPEAEDFEKECARYTALLRKMPADIGFLGIGENGHLAFNDPHVAFFDDPEVVKIIDLAPMCRAQQVNDGCFKSLDQVPTHAMTITIPEIMRIEKLFAMVPSTLKANAVKATCDGPVSENCPASILKIHKDATLYLDTESASLLDY